MKQLHGEYSYAWAPVTTSPNSSVFDRWFEICEDEATTEHIRCCHLHSTHHLLSKIADCESSKAVAMIVINTENNYRIETQHFPHPLQKGGYPVLVVTKDDGNKLIRELQRYKQGGGFIARIKEGKEFEGTRSTI